MRSGEEALVSGHSFAQYWNLELLDFNGMSLQRKNIYKHLLCVPLVIPEIIQGFSDQDDIQQSSGIGTAHYIYSSCNICQLTSCTIYNTHLDHRVNFTIPCSRCFATLSKQSVSACFKGVIFPLYSRITLDFNSRGPIFDDFRYILVYELYIHQHSTCRIYS